MIGTYGMVVNVYPDNLNTSHADGSLPRRRRSTPNTSTSRIEHTFTAQTTYIWERQSYNASYPRHAGDGLGLWRGSDAGQSHRHAANIQAQGSYYYERKYGGTPRVFPDHGQRGRGSLRADCERQCPHAEQQRLSSPNSTTCRSRTCGSLLQYTGYSKFNGARTNYDGTGRNAKRQQHAVLRRLGGVLSRERGAATTGPRSSAATRCESGAMQ